MIELILLKPRTGKGQLKMLWQLWDNGSSGSQVCWDRHWTARRICLGEEETALIYFTDLERFIALFRFGQLKVDMSGRWGENLKLS